MREHLVPRGGRKTGSLDTKMILDLDVVLDLNKKQDCTVIKLHRNKNIPKAPKSPLL